MNRKLKNEELGRPDIETFQNSEKTPIVVILDNIRSLNNIGSVFRTSDAFGIEAIMLCGISAKPPHREINKTALGATESVSWVYYEQTESAIKKVKSEGFKVFAVEQAENSISLNDFKVGEHEKVALVFGHEVKGVAQSIVNICDEVIEIPQKGTKHSLNISVSVGVVLWDIARKMEAL